MNKGENQVTVLKVQTVSELAKMYGVSRPTFKTWLKPFEHKIGVRVGWYYSIAQVRTIYECLGLPNRTIETNLIKVD